MCKTYCIIRLLATCLNAEWLSMCIVMINNTRKIYIKNGTLNLLYNYARTNCNYQGQVNLSEQYPLSGHVTSKGI